MVEIYVVELIELVVLPELAIVLLAAVLVEESLLIVLLIPSLVEVLIVVLELALGEDVPGLLKLETGAVEAGSVISDVEDSGKDDVGVIVSDGDVAVVDVLERVDPAGGVTDVEVIVAVDTTTAVDWPMEELAEVAGVLTTVVSASLTLLNCPSTTDVVDKTTAEDVEVVPGTFVVLVVEVSGPEYGGDSTGWTRQSCCGVTRSLINVTAPYSAYRPPPTLTPLFNVIDVNARMFPAKTVSVPSVADDPTCQKTLHACAPLTSRTVEAVAVVKVDPI
jgi:hypothetical protein